MGTKGDRKYRINSDLHTHTTFSHGKGSIEDNIKAAISKGITTLGISDHGPGHLTYGIKRKNIPILRAEINRLQLLYPQIEVLLGVEANILNDSGTLDLTEQEVEEFDYILAGYHYGILGETPLKAMKIHTQNYLLTKLGKSTEKQKNLNTDLAVKAIYSNDIKILTHPGDKGPFDIYQLAVACADKGTLMEVSTWHPYLSVEGIKEAAKTSVKFIINSDAHSPERIGDCAGAVERIRKAGIDLERVVNLEVL
jgi:putative hydrolase